LHNKLFCISIINPLARIQIGVTSNVFLFLQFSKYKGIDFGTNNIIIRNVDLFIKTELNNEKWYHVKY